MGWYHDNRWPTKDAVVDEIRRMCENRLMDSALRGNELWTLIRDNNGVVTIVLFLLRRCRGLWGYKDMCEGMGPYYYKCPLKFLDTAPSTNEDWRKRVRDTRARSQWLPKIKVGTRVALVPGVTVLGNPIENGAVVRLDPLAIDTGVGLVNIKKSHIRAIISP